MATSIEFLERWLEDRGAALKTLVSGTPDHFLYTALLAEQNGATPAQEAALAEWMTANPHHEYTALFTARRRLTRWGESADGDAATLELLKRALGVSNASFNHARPQGAAPDAHAAAADDATPTALDGAALTADAMVARALSEAKARGNQDLTSLLRHTDTAVMEHPAVLAALAADASGAALATAIQTAGLPQVDGAVSLLARALGSKWATEHGLTETLCARAFPALTLAQLQELASTRPELKASHTWGAAVLSRLAPPAAVDFRTDRAALRGYLDALWAAVGGLPESYNVVRLTVLHHRLRLELDGAYPRAAGRLAGSPAALSLLEQYAALPRSATGWNNAVPGMWDRGPREARVRVGAEVQLPVGRRNPLCAALAVAPPTPAEDEALLREALSDVFAAGTEPPGTATARLAPWDRHVNAPYLRGLMAEARLTRGTDADREAAHLWAPHLPGGVAGLQSLKDRRTLALHARSPEYYRPADDVVLAFTAKNLGPSVSSVAVRVFEVNTTSYYADKGAEVPTDMPLDGLLPHETHAVPVPGAAASPLRCQDVVVPLPSLSGFRRGVWVVELVAGGTSCRAIIRKGGLRHVERPSVAGHVLTLLDEDNAPLPAGRVSAWMAGRRYTPQAAATAPSGAGAAADASSAGAVIVIPYAAAATAASRPLVLTLEDDDSSAPAGAGAGAVAGGWSFSTLVPSFEHRAEGYRLDAAFHVDREAVVADNYNAAVLVRPRLQLLGSVPAPLGALTNVALTIDSTDGDGVPSQRVIRNMRLYADKESVVPFAVPPGVRSLTFRLTADVEIVATGAKQGLSASHAVAVNGIDGGSHTRTAHLRCTESDGYCVYLLGKTGEPVPGATMHVHLEHALVDVAHEADVKTDAHGRVRLGPLEGFTAVHVSGYATGAGDDHSGGGHAEFSLPEDVAAFATTVHTTTAELVQARVPFRPSASALAAHARAHGAGAAYVPSRADCALEELRSVARDGAGGYPDVLVADHGRCVSYDAAGGFLVVKGLPAGEFRLTVKRPSPRVWTCAPPVTIRVLPGGPGTRLRAGYLASGDTLLQVRGAASTGAGGDAAPTTLATPLSIASVGVDGGALAVRVSGGAGGGGGGASSRDVRVHVLATTFVPPWDAGAALASLGVPGLATLAYAPVRSRYLNGRTLGEEQQYILDRQALVGAGRVHAGNNLPRPQLLLNPWSLGTVATDVQTAKEGSAYARHAAESAMHGGRGRLERYTGGGARGSHGEYVSLDFLPRPATLLANLRPPEDGSGVVRVPLEELGAGDGGEVYVTVVAVDAVNTASTSLPVALAPASSAEAAAAAPARDLTAARPQLDPTTHVLQQSRVSVLRSPGESVTVSSTGTRVEVYGSLDRAFGLLAALSGDAALSAEFGWLLSWPRLSDAERRARYSKHACHEVHLFLFFRDAPFFEAVVAPFLAAKRSKSFVDHWLLGHDTAAYAAPHAYEQLNALERALLAAHAGTPAAAAAAARRAADWVDANPVPREQREAIFAAALASNALDDKAASDDAVAALVREQEQRRQQQRQSAAPVPAPAPHYDMTQQSESRQAQPRMLMGANGGGGGAMRAMAKRAGPMPGMAMAMGAPPPPMMAMASAMPMAAMMAMPAPPQAYSDGLMMASYDAGAMHDAADDEAEAASADLARRESGREAASGFRPVDKTLEFAEAHYHRVHAGDDGPALVPLCEYWADLTAHMAVHVQPAVAAAAGGSPAARRAAVHAALAAAPFVSPHFTLCTGNATQQLAALAVLGLPWEADEAAPPAPPTPVLTDGGLLRFTAAGTPAVLFHRDLSAVPGLASSPGADGAAGSGSGSGGSSSVLVGQFLFDPSDREEIVRGQRVDKFLPPGAEVAPGAVVGCVVVITNVSPAALSLDVQTHIPAGALPVDGGAVTKDAPVRLDGFSTTRREYSFYFPRPGVYGHYPVHVSCEGALVAHAAPTTLTVRERPARADTSSWAYLAASASDEAVLAHLAGPANSAATDLAAVLWRCKASPAFWRRLVGVLRGRAWFHEGVWSYGLAQQLGGGSGSGSGSGSDAFLTGVLREYLSRPESLGRLRATFFGRLPVLASPLLRLVGEAGVGATGDAVADAEPVLTAAIMGSGGGGADDGSSGAAYEHLEYSPLINARAHQLGASRRIPNKAVERQYRTLLRVLACKPAGDVTPADRLAVTYHLLLQDRVDDALRMFARVAPPAGSVAATAAAAAGSNGAAATAAGASSWCTLQYDYTAAYLDFYRSDGAPFPVAAAVAAAYRGHPVPKWAARFRELETQLAEAGVVVGGGSGSAQRPADAPLGSGVSAGESGVGSELSREAAHSRGAAAEPSLELSMDGGAAALTFASLPPSAPGGATADVTLRCYCVDLELLFSTSPFLGVGKAAAGGGSSSSSSSGSAADALGQFAFVRPTRKMTVAVPAGASGSQTVALPADLGASNLMVEAVAAGVRRVTPHFANKLTVTVSEHLGRLRVAAADSGRPLPRTYVKVYFKDAASAAGAGGRFMKDGYTDLRGVFDYASLSTDELSRATRLAVLVASETHGAAVREVAPPPTAGAGGPRPL